MIKRPIAFRNSKNIYFNFANNNNNDNTIAFTWGQYTVIYLCTRVQSSDVFMIV